MLCDVCMWSGLQSGTHIGKAALPCSWDQPHTLLMKSALPATTPAEISEWPFKYLVALSHTTSMPTSAGLHLHATLSISPTWPTCKQELANKTRRNTNTCMAQNRSVSTLSAHAAIAIWASVQIHVQNAVCKQCITNTRHFGASYRLSNTRLAVAGRFSKHSPEASQT